MGELERSHRQQPILAVVPALQRLRRIAALATVLVLVGCAASGPGLNGEKLDISAFAHVTAKLNHETGEIELPLAAYTTNSRERQLIDRANNVLLDRCLKAKGFGVPIDAGIMQPFLEDRRYGIWLLSDAERYGYEPPAPRPLIGFELKVDSPQHRAYFQCRDELQDKLLPVLADNAAGDTSPPAVAARAAYVQASADPAWSNSKTAWKECLEKHGLKLPNTEAWTPDLPQSSEERVRVAVQDIGCKRETNLIQNLANLEARYQAAYIASRQGEFNKVRDEKAAVLAKAQALVSGGL